MLLNVTPSCKPQQIARLSKIVQQLEMILSKKKTGRKNSESASMELESKTGASGVPSADSAVSKLSCARNIPGASAAAFPTARPDSDSEFTDPGSSGKRTALQAALADRPIYVGENFRRAAVEKSVLADESLVERRKRRSLPTVQQMQSEAFITFALDYFRKKSEGERCRCDYTTYNFRAACLYLQ